MFIIANKPHADSASAPAFLQKKCGCPEKQIRHNKANYYTGK
jgi:hypothetical protein